MFPNAALLIIPFYLVVQKWRFTKKNFANYKSTSTQIIFYFKFWWICRNIACFHRK